MASFRAGREARGSEPLRVVVVDDVPEIRDIVQMMLESHSRFRVVAQCADGAAGIEAAEREQPDVVLLDIDMPGMDGWEALPRIKEVAPDAAVVVFTGDGSPVSARRTAVERGAHGHLQKGLEARRLAPQLLYEIGHAPHATPDLGARRAPTVLQDEPPDVARNRLAAIVESSEDAIVAEGLDGTILSWSHGAERIFGYTAEEIVGGNIAQLLPEQSASELAAITERTRAGERVHLETTRQRKDGVLIDVALTVSPIADREGTVVGTTVIARDLGDRDRRDRALARAIAQLDRQNRSLLQTNEELDRFAYVASHDLAQPLQVMYGYLELLQVEYGTSIPPTAAEWLQVVMTNLERMRQLVRDLLHYARLGASPGARNEVDCNVVLADALSDLRAVIDERAAAVSTDSLPVVEGDRTQLGQVFLNLIGNAIKHTPSDRVPEVHVSASREGELHRIDVDDTGPGVATKDRARIFEMFQRATAASEGSGMGLAISKRVVEHHGGRIWVENRPGGGSRFSFTLRPAP